MSKENSLLHPVNELHLDRYVPDDVPQALNIASSLAKQRIADIIALPDKLRTYDNTVRAKYEATKELDLISTVVGHLSITLSGQWQEAESLASTQAEYFETKLEQDTKLYNAIKLVQENAAELDLTEPQRRSLQDEIDTFERNGINTSPWVKIRLKFIKARLAKLKTQYGQNLVKAEGRAYLPVESATDLDGINPEDIAAYRDEAKRRGMEGYVIPFSDPNYWSIMVDCKSEKIRREMHKLWRTCAPKNERLATETLVLRKKMAKLLGRTSFAEYKIESGMAKTEETVRNFLDELTELCLPGMHREAAELKAYVEKVTGKPYELNITDVDSGVDLFWANQLAKELTGDKTIDVSEYFPLEQVQEQMFATLGTLYGITFRPSTQAVYHEDVKAYDVIDEQGNHISTIWCDWLAREGKRSGAAQRTAYIADRAGGTCNDPHLLFIRASFPRPTENKPSLLSFDDVRTMWHEFGHAMHCALSKTELRSQHSAWSKWDFFEAPSQIMENWPWQEEILTNMAKHYKTGKPLPPEFIQNMQKTQNFRAASKMLWTLYWATVDQRLHSKDYNPKKDGTPNEVARRIKQRFLPVQVAEYDNGINTNGHSFTGYYAGSQYSYVLGQSIEADLFSCFEQEGILNPFVGRRYRDELLAMGNQRDPEVSVSRFLGRAVNPRALLKRMGIAA